MAAYKVLVPLDGSPEAEEALAYLPMLRTLGDLHVRLVAVASSQPAHERDERMHKNEETLKAYLTHQQLRLTADGEVEPVMRHGLPGPAIVGEARSFNADLILMSSHGRLGLERWRLGSVTEKVARQAYTNVMVVPPGLECASEPISSILVPLDGSEAAEAAIEVGRALAVSWSAQLHLAHVIAPSTSSADLRTSHSVLRDRAMAYLASKQAGLHLTPEPTLAILSGQPQDLLRHYSESEHVGLIVLTGHGASGSTVGLGRVADSILQGAKPVLLVRAPR